MRSAATLRRLEERDRTLDDRRQRLATQIDEIDRERRLLRTAIEALRPVARAEEEQQAQRRERVERGGGGASSDAGGGEERLRDRITACLVARRGKAVSSSEVAAELAVDRVQIVGMLLARMAAEEGSGVVRAGAHWYRASTPAEAAG